MILWEMILLSIFYKIYFRYFYLYSNSKNKKKFRRNKIIIFGIRISTKYTLRIGWFENAIIFLNYFLITQKLTNKKLFTDTEEESKNRIIRQAKYKSFLILKSFKFYNWNNIYIIISI